MNHVFFFFFFFFLNFSTERTRFNISKCLIKCFHWKTRTTQPYARQNEVTKVHYGLASAKSQEIKVKHVKQILLLSNLLFVVSNHAFSPGLENGPDLFLA